MERRFGRGLRRSARQAAESRSHAVILSIDSVAAAHHEQKLEEKHTSPSMSF
jgi:hypothetical protein